MKPSPHCIWVRALLFRSFTDTNVYRTRFCYNMENLPQNIGGYTNI